MTRQILLRILPPRITLDIENWRDDDPLAIVASEAQTGDGKLSAEGMGALGLAENKLATAIEQTFQISLDLDDVTKENFHSTNTLDAMIQRERA